MCASRGQATAEAWSYNVLQRLSYLFVIFVLFPLVIWTGLAMSPAFVSAFPATVTWLGGQQSARTIHFFVSLALLLFLLVHVVMICVAGFKSRMRAMITGPSPGRRRSVHERSLAPKIARHRNRSHRRSAGLGVAARLAQQYGLVPPDHGGIYGLGETLTYAAQRLLTRHSLAREFRPEPDFEAPVPNELAPLSEEFKRLQSAGFADWRLAVDGLVDRPASFSLRS